MERRKKVLQCGNDPLVHLGDISANWSRWLGVRVIGDWTGGCPSIRRTGEANLRMKQAYQQLEGVFFLHLPGAADRPRAHVGLAPEEGWDD
jgi:hypothetical protein